MLDKKAHIKGKGISCPFCGSSSIEGGFIEIEKGKALQGMECTECEGEWQDIYELIDMSPYPAKEVTDERIPNKTPGLAGLLGQRDRN